MKGRHCTTAMLAVLTLLFACGVGFAKSVRTSPKHAAAKHRKAKTAGSIAPNQNPDNGYTVRRGENLIQIARANHVTVKALKAANGLKSSRIKEGQKLLIPADQNAASLQKAPPASAARAEANKESADLYISQLKKENLISEDESTSMRLRLVEAGFQMLGIRYRRSGSSEKTGFDCSGLVKNLFSKFNIDLPRSSREQYKQGEKVDRDKLEIGDLVFFSSGGKNPTHVGIYIGDNKFLHAALKARQVVVGDLSKIWYTMRYLGARRIADLWGDGSDSQPENK